MSGITLGAPSAAPTIGRSASKSDNGAAGFGAALADAMVPERPASPFVKHGHGQRAERQTIQPKTNSVADHAGSKSPAEAPGTVASDAPAPTDAATTVAPALVTPAPVAPAPVAGPLVAALAVAGGQAQTSATTVGDADATPTVAGSTLGSETVTTEPAGTVGTSPAVAALSPSASPVVSAPTPSVASPSVPSPSVPTPSVPTPSVPTLSVPTPSAAAGTASTPAAGTAAEPATAPGETAEAPARTGGGAPALDVSAVDGSPADGHPADTRRPDAAAGSPSVSSPLATTLPAQVAAAVPGSVRDESAPKPDASVSGAAGAVAPAPAQGVQGATSAAAPAQAAPPANAPTFAAQLAKPLFTLATGPAGDQIVTVKVTPENLGPVTVRAHIGADGVRMELFAPNDAGREALRAILTDLRRDLAGQGASANLDLSSQNQPTDSGDRGARHGAPALPDRQTSAAVETETATVRRDLASTSSLDVLA